MLLGAAELGWVVRAGGLLGFTARARVLTARNCVRIASARASCPCDLRDFIAGNDTPISLERVECIWFAL